MTSATYDDVIQLFPGMQDHTVVEILAVEATVNELEGVLLSLQGNDSNDEQLIDMKKRKGSRLNLLLGILADSEIQLRDEFES